MPSHVRTLCRNSVVWRADRCHCQAAEFMLHIYYKISSKLYMHYKITLNTPFQGKKFLFPWLKILLGHSNRCTLCNPHQLSCGILSSWEGREILAISLLCVWPDPQLILQHIISFCIFSYEAYLPSMPSPTALIFISGILLQCWLSLFEMWL